MKEPLKAFLRWEKTMKNPLTTHPPLTKPTPPDDWFEDVED